AHLRVRADDAPRQDFRRRRQVVDRGNDELRQPVARPERRGDPHDSRRRFRKENGGHFQGGSQEGHSRRPRKIQASPHTRARQGVGGEPDHASAVKSPPPILGSNYLPPEITMPLTNEQRRYLEKRLQDERERALQLVNRIVADRSGESEQDASGDLTLMPFHPADLGTDEIDEAVDESNATRASQELAEIDAALERLYKSPAKFGVCDDGREIPFERLDIIPWARTCD